MRFRDHVALTLPALVLRLVLCVTFFWAGLGKLMGEFEVTGDDAARLVRMGAQPEPVAPVSAPAHPLPEPDRSGASDSVDDTPPNPTPEEPPSGLVVPDAEAAPAAEPEAEGAEPAPAGAKPGESHAKDESAGYASQWSGGATAGTIFADQDYEGVYRVQRVGQVALLLSKAGNPGLDAQSQPLPRTMPAWVAAERWPIYLAWAAAITEMLAATMLFFGVLTRLGGLMLATVMAMAMWLTQIGPAAMGVHDAWFGIIPRATDPWAPDAYATLLWQLACFTMAAAVVMLGSGPIGFDRALFRPGEKLERSSPKRERSTFDRGPSEP